MARGIDRLAARLRGARRVTVLTGAGVSAASGIPTFRGAGGLWNPLPEPRTGEREARFPSAAADRGRGALRAQDLATPEAFARDPKTVWDWYAWRRELAARAKPNRAHEVLAAWSRRFPGFALVTQNVDGLHERAGTAGVLRFHGSLWEVGCWDRCAKAPARWSDERVPFPEMPPRCRHCGGLLRPGVVWFGEAIDPEVHSRALAALDCDVCLVVGTSAVVYPAAGLAAEAKRRGAFTAEVNPEATDASAAMDVAIAERAEVALDEIDRRLRPLT